MFTLADAQNLSQNKLTKFVIDQFRQSPLLDKLVFDDTVKPQGGKTLAYTYNRITTLPTASGRAIGSEYAPQEAKTTPITVLLKVFGGAFQLDRVLQNDEKQLLDLCDFEVSQKVKAARALFADWFINGDSTADPLAFDGVDKAVTGSSTEYKLTAPLDLSTADAIEKNWKAFLFYLQQALKLLDGEPTIMAVNRDMFAVFQTVANYATQFTATKATLGAPIIQYGNAIIMDMGDKPGTANPIVETTEITEGGNSYFASDIFFTRIGLDGVHGISVDGASEPKIYLPNFASPGAVKTGEVEMIAAMAIKATKAAGVFRNIKIG